MREINLAAKIVQYRKARDLTQEELANYIGVSKAAVSKWETGQSLPDIALLPVIAAYFNTSVDDLIDYQPQLTKKQIQQTYQRFCRDFASRPFDEVLAELRQMARAYSACFTMLFQLGGLLLNHADMAATPEQAQAVYEEAKALFRRVQKESGDVEQVKQAKYMEAYCLVQQHQLEEALALLEQMEHNFKMTGATLLSQIYMLLGRNGEAKEVLQAEVYQCMAVILSCFPSLLLLAQDDEAKLDDCMRRISDFDRAFGIQQMHPSVMMPVWLTGAQCYAALDKKEKALDLLQSYTQLVTGDIYPLKLQGNDFFDAINKWFEDLDLGTALPRSEEVVKRSMWEAVSRNPAYAPLHQESRFQAMLKQLEHNFKK